jgi:hypothetical protein
MVFVADLTNDSPMHLEINGTVLEALGLTSIMKTSSS